MSFEQDLSSDPVLSYRDTELVLGFVYPLGTNREQVLRALEDRLQKFGYNANLIRLSDHLSKLKLGLDFVDTPEDKRIECRMDAGNKAREISKRQDLVSLCAISQISRSRAQMSDPKTPKPRRRIAHILDSLKRPEEVHLLRQIYGPGFYLIGIYCTEKKRREYLEDDKNIVQGRAIALIKRDAAEEGVACGQRTRDTFHLADVFIRLSDADDYKVQLWRFLDLVFGDPFSTPTPDEQAMFFAHAASLRSASLSRQVGAAITSDSGELISVGCNDVPCAGGGLYWPGVDDKRDHKLGYDSNDRRRKEIIADLMERLRPDISPAQRIEVGIKELEGSPLMEITEYGRAVHAEMEALLSCTRSGISPLKGTLYSTTFPCHNCARHIVASGLARVVYVEPYPKSKALELHNDSIEVEEYATGGDQNARKVTFDHFVGIGPRRYFDLFSMRPNAGELIKRKVETEVKQWDQTPQSRVRVPMLPSSYLQREQIVVNEIANILNNLED